MALQVWLPLNGDTRNYGVSNLNFNMLGSGNTTIDNAGKIGKCYSNNAWTNGGFVSDKKINLSKSQSMFCWFKYTNLNSSSSLGCGIISQHRYPTNAGLGLTIRYVSSTTGYISVNTGNGSSRTYNAYYGTTLLQAGIWYHGGLTYDGTTLKIYLNGVCEKEVSMTDQLCLEDYLMIFAWSLNDNNYSSSVVHGNYHLNGCLNDVRIYDHCLSPKEVKEISKALIVHYPMNGGGKGLPNYLVNSNFYNRTSSWGGVNGSSVSVVKKDGRNTITATKGTSNMLICQVMSTYSYTKNTTITFTISADVYTEVEGTLNVGNWITTTEASGWQGMNLTEIWNTPNTLHVGWNHISVTHKNASKQYTGSIITGFGYTGTTCFFTNIKFEFSDKETPWMPHTGDGIYNKYVGSIAKEYDTSGFGYNATVVGSLELTSDTPRYLIATGPFGSGKGLYCSPHPCQRADGNPITVSCWFKQLGRSGYQYIVCNRDGSNGYNWMLYTHTTDGSIQLHGDAQYKSSSIPSLNEWHHVVAVVYANQTYSLFLDGSKVVNATTYKYHAATSNYLCVGKYGTTTTCSGPFNGYISDVRIYATALSDADILELYKTGASIDNKGNLLTYEIVEG